MWMRRSHSFTFLIAGFADAASSSTGKGPNVHKLKLSHVAEINPELHPTTTPSSPPLPLSTSSLACSPCSSFHSFNVRSFFSDRREIKDIGAQAGLQLWCGYFQPIRPTMGKMLINVHISTERPNALSPKFGLLNCERIRLQRFISGTRLVTTHTNASGAEVQTPRIIKKFSQAGTSAPTFQLREG
ncbi:hypothetical protein FB45DRAFT_1111026 [Roridomyces roridus]|uniref:Argonaute linker 1 domain-containing protein n=1 Tax=Roridomyces roridus TaxID=1738132 RepID=A0AAD7B9L0_9AGAR|nr:hypothetical protein FB45DRAFT_1111026 [Roridomyces roridus]